MVGCFSSHPDDRYRESELDKYLDERDSVIYEDPSPSQDDVEFEREWTEKAKTQFNGLFSSIASAVMK